MKVIWGLENARHHPSTISTLGSYDGLHLGHREILSTLEERKYALGLERSVLLTFHPHPQQVLRRNDSTIKLLTTIEERLDLLGGSRIDEVVVIRFTPEFSSTSYIDFFRETLVAKLGTRAMVVGFNHAFGKNREGDAEHLRSLAVGMGIVVEEVPPLVLDGLSISSTKIRHALLDGDMGLASRMLGRPFRFTGVVTGGDGVGKTLGFPTANLTVAQEKLIPISGVYAALVTYRGERYVAALSIGHRPSIAEGLDLAIEVFLLDFEGSLYDERLTVDCIEYLRPQEQFATLTLLKDQIAKDVSAVREVLAARSKVSGR